MVVAVMVVMPAPTPVVVVMMPAPTPAPMMVMPVTMFATGRAVRIDGVMNETRGITVRGDRRIGLLGGDGHC